jgi:hypothetical protein
MKSPSFILTILAPQLGVEEYYGAKLDVASIPSRSGLPWGCSLQDGDRALSFALKPCL